MWHFNYQRYLLCKDGSINFIILHESRSLVAIKGSISEKLNLLKHQKHQFPISFQSTQKNKKKRLFSQS